MSQLTFAVGFGLAMLLAGCLKLPEPVQSAPTTPQSVGTQSKATLEGYFTRLDGKYASHAWLETDIDPGCHVLVVGASRWSTRATEVRLSKPRVRYIRFIAKPQFHYAIERVRKYVSSAMTPHGVVIHETEMLIERDEHGSETRRYTESEEEVAPHRC